MSYYQPQSSADISTLKNLLYNRGLGYINKANVEQKCAELMVHTSINTVSAEVYTHTNGVSETLIKIEGLLPIEYNKATYNIPVCF